jgi:predicted nucleic acid-binding protein
LIVLDASAAVELVLGTNRAIAREVLNPDQQIHAPYLVDVEVTQTLRRLLLARQLTPVRAEEALADFGLLAIARHPHAPLLRRMWALRANLSACDATYVVLAEALDAPLLTCDAKLAGASGHRAQIQLVRPERGRTAH